MAVRTEALTKRQDKQFDTQFDKLVKLVERDARVDDYAVGKKTDGHFTGDCAAQYVEFIKGDLVYTVLLCVRRVEGDT